MVLFYQKLHDIVGIDILNHIYCIKQKSRLARERLIFKIFYNYLNFPHQKNYEALKTQ